MKKIFVFILTFLLFFISFAQDKVNYQFLVKNNFVGKTFKFPASLTVNEKGDQLYTVLFSLNQNENGEVNGGNVVLYDTETAMYYLFRKRNSDRYLISQKIKNQTYLFEDDVKHLDWKFSDETKKQNGVLLHKAETTFRGRTYVVWYDSQSKFNAAPWKFNNLKGIIYEAYDTEHLFEWKLTSIIKEKNIEVKFPFKDVTERLSYKEYPKLEYAYEKEVLESAKKYGIKLPPHPRENLEIEFEWEK